MTEPLTQVLASRRSRGPLSKREQALQWLQNMFVPIAPGLRVHYGGHNYGGTLGETSAYDAGRNRVLWKGSMVTAADRRDLAHEAGHAFDYQMFTDQERERVRRLIAPHNTTQWRWGNKNPTVRGSGPDPFEEKFADVYADLALSKHGWPKLRALLAQVAARRSAQVAL